jgi:uncharacterized membrane protein YbhN (UPF0104 family)
VLPTPTLFVLSALVATFVLWRKGSLNDIGPTLRTLPPERAIVILAVYAISILVLTLRWHSLARIAGNAPAWFSSAEVFLTSVIVNYAAPIGLAVPTRAALTVRDLGLTPTESSAVVAWELLLDLAALSVLSAGWLAMGGAARLGDPATGARFVVAGVAVALVAVVACALGLRMSPVARRLSGSATQVIRFPARQPGRMIVAIGLTVLFWSMQTSVMAALLEIFGTSPSVRLMLGIMGLPILIGMLSPVPGGAGVRETLMATAAGLQGVAAAPVLLAAIAYRLALFVVTPVVWSTLRLARTLTFGR